MSHLISLLLEPLHLLVVSSSTLILEHAHIQDFPYLKFIFRLQELSFLMSVLPINFIDESIFKKILQVIAVCKFLMQCCYLLQSQHIVQINIFLHNIPISSHDSFRFQEILFVQVVITDTRYFILLKTFDHRGKGLFSTLKWCHLKQPISHHLKS